MKDDIAIGITLVLVVIIASAFYFYGYRNGSTAATRDLTLYYSRQMMERCK